MSLDSRQKPSGPIVLLVHACLAAVLLLVVAHTAAADGTFPTGNCTADVLGMSGLPPSKSYPNAAAMRSFTGAGDYGFTIYLGDWDPGKWQGCVELDTAAYCVATYRQTIISNQSVGVCVPSSCNGTELMNLPPGVAVDKLKLPVEFGMGFTAQCIPKTAPLPVGAWLVLSFVGLLVVLVVVATATEYALNHQMVSFDISSSVNILVREEETQAAGAIEDGESLPIDPNAPGVKRRYISVIDEETEQELRAKAEAAKAAKRQRISHTLRRKGPVLLRVLLMWSATYNFERLIANPPPDSLMCFNGIRVLSLLSVVLGHTYFFMWLCLSLTNIRYMINTVVPKFMFQMVPATYYAVDSFFFMSGFLMAYLFTKQLQKHGLTLLTLPLLYLHRILRLTPSLALALMVYWQLAPYVSDGPAWRYFKIWVDNSCDANWWKVLLYVQNLTNDPENACMSWTWYLAVDMQLFFVSPLFLITYHNHRVAGWVLTICALVACIGANIGIAWDNDLYAHPFFEFLNDRKGAPPGGDIMKLIYMKPWTRAGPYLVGFISAFIALDHGDRMRIAPAFRTVLYAVSLLILGVLAFITYTEVHYGWSQAFNVIFIGFNRTLWGVGLAILVLMCVQRYWGVIRTALESPLWAPFARLSYAAYLYHLVVVGVVYMSQQSNYTYQFATAMYFFIGHTVFSYIVAFAHYMLFEKPLMNFEAMLLRRYEQQ